MGSMVESGSTHDGTLWANSQEAAADGQLGGAMDGLDGRVGVDT